ncbi:MAG: MFS transporter [Opitutaceae bacterium]|nr:MFS transporter [Cytophagales bacterium]
MPRTQSLNLKIPIKLPKGAWLVVALLCVVGCLNYLDRVMITTMRSSITDSLKINDAEFGLLTSVFLWVYGFLSPFAGFLADKFKRSRVIIVSLFVWSAVTYLTAHASTFNELLLTRALMGLSEACYIPAALALISDYHRGTTRSLATGLHMGGVMVGQSLGFAGGWIADKYHWTDAFGFFGIFGITYSLVLVFFLKDVGEKNKDEVEDIVDKSEINFMTGIKNLFKHRSFNLLLVFWALLGVVGWMLVGWLPTYYKEHFNLSQTLGGFYATAYIYPMSFVGVILGGILADRFSRKNPKGRVWVPAIGLCIAAPAIFLASSTDVVWITIIGFALYALTRTFSDTNLMPILCMIADPRYRATGYGVLNMFACLVGGLGIYASGVLRDAHIDLSIMFRVAGLLMLVCAYILYVIKLKYNTK